MRGRGSNRFFSLIARLAVAVIAVTLPLFAKAAKPSLQHAALAMSGDNPVAHDPVPSSEAPGDILMARGNYAAAIDAYQQSAVRTAVTWNKIGVAYHHLFALEEARKNYQMALSLDPKYSAALNNLAAVYHGEKNYRQAERTYKKALKYEPNSAITYRNLGTAYFSDGKYKQGREACRKAMALDRDIFVSEAQSIDAGSSRQQRIAMSYYLAKAYAVAGNNEQALDYLQKALDAGFSDRRRLMEDSEFARLRTTPEFQRLVVQ